MTASGLDKLTVTGAGVLGGQIAWQSAFKGKTVTVYDLNEEALNNCRAAQQTYEHIYKNDLGATDQDIEETKARLTFTTDLKEAAANADIV